MHCISLVLACLISLVYIASGNTRHPEEAQKPDTNLSTAELEPISEQLDTSLLSSEEDFDKRDWNKLNGMWGKRADWNKLNGMWGKRENMDSYWGKRGWNNLSNVWGKRTSSRDDGSKRTTQWNNLKSVWGKRNADWDVPAVWDRLPLDESLQDFYNPDQM